MTTHTFIQRVVTSYIHPSQITSHLSCSSTIFATRDISLSKSIHVSKYVILGTFKSENKEIASKFIYNALERVYVRRVGKIQILRKTCIYWAEMLKLCAWFDTFSKQRQHRWYWRFRHRNVSYKFTEETSRYQLTYKQHLFLRAIKCRPVT